MGWATAVGVLLYTVCNQRNVSTYLTNCVNFDHHVKETGLYGKRISRHYGTVTFFSSLAVYMQALVYSE